MHLFTFVFPGLHVVSGIRQILNDICFINIALKVLYKCKQVNHFYSQLKGKIGHDSLRNVIKSLRDGGKCFELGESLCLPSELGATNLHNSQSRALETAA